MGYVINLPGGAGSGLLVGSAPVVLGTRRSINVPAGVFLGPEMADFRLHHRRLQESLIHPHIEEFWLCPLLRFAHADFLRGHDPADPASGIVQISGDDRLRRTDDDAGRLQTHLDPMGAVIAFRGRVGVRIDVERVVGTGLHAGFAADAAAVIEIDDAVGAAKQRAGRADFNAGGIVAMVAPQDAKVAPGMRELAFFYVFDPRPKNPDWNIVLFLAGHRARVAANAAILIDDKPVAHPCSPKPDV